LDLFDFAALGMRDTFFITGGSGMVGREIVTRLLAQTEADVILLIHEQGVMNGSVDESRVTRVQGDITQPNCGLDETTLKLIRERTTHVIHSAASTRFDLALQEARRINVFGTQQVTELAFGCSQLRQFGFLSTVYISGKRTGLILEEELEHVAGFVNTYEQSKYEAEILLQGMKQKLPLAIYRLSTVIGDSQTGQVTHFTAPHQALRMMYLGLASMLPGTPEYQVDLVSSNDSAQAVVDLFLKAFVAGRTYHVSEGDRSLELQELIDLSLNTMSTVDPGWAARQYPKPLIVKASVFDLFLASAVSADNPVLRNTLTALGHFAHQLTYPKQFSQRAVRAALPDYVRTSPDIRLYYPKVVEYCLRTRWGKLTGI
jgi:thioester reductase-like protein